MQRLQRTVAQFVEQHQLATSIEHRLLDLVSEVGELSKEALKASQYGRQQFAPCRSWDEEMGDILFSLICIANQSGVDLAQALERALIKYRARILETGDAQSGR
jgi:NTP pyrophosphatase (non-canonical NTP hydrolase)